MVECGGESWLRPLSQHLFSPQVVWVQAIYLCTLTPTAGYGGVLCLSHHYRRQLHKGHNIFHSFTSQGDTPRQLAQPLPTLRSNWLDALSLFQDRPSSANLKYLTTHTELSPIFPKATVAGWALQALRPRELKCRIHISGKLRKVNCIVRSTFAPKERDLKVKL